jgi:hypothetical protein
MSQLSVVPDILKSASGCLENMGAGLRTANAAAAAQTTAIAAPALDEISTAISALLGKHGQQFQAWSAQSAAYHDHFVSMLNGGAAQYMSAEFANVQQTLSSAGGAVGIAEASPLDTLISLSTVSQSANYGPLQVSSSYGLGGLYQSAILNGPFGQLGSFSLSGAPVFPTTSTGGVAGLVLNATGTLNTAVGPVTWLSANGSMLVSPTGGFVGSMSGPTPFGPAALTVNGTVPTVTGGLFTALGWEFYFQGTQFGFTPLFLRPLGLA